MEVADELAKSGKTVTLVEKLPHVLSLAFDPEFAVRAEEILASRGVKLKTGVGVRQINGDTHVTGVQLDNGETLPADAVVLSIGYRPNSALAETPDLRSIKWGSSGSMNT
ncbi:MAG: FAD-dependent oxidoreductase [Desulfobacterales bacterium]